MKVLHVADLHIGKNVNGFSMLEDQREILAQILEYVKSEAPDAVLIAGDIYDKPAPGVEAVRLFDQFLTDLQGEGVAVFFISGNHDAPERLSFASRIMQDQKVYAGGVFDGRLHKVTMEDGWGPLHVHLLPFLRPSMVRRHYEGVEIQSYQDAVRVVIENAAINWEERNLLIAHQFFVSYGREPERSESEVGPVGGIDSIESDVVSRFDYVALGHLHGPQQVGFPHVRYGGSPLKYSLSECHHNKSAVLVTLREKGDAEVKLLPLKPRRDMRKIKGPIQELLSEEVRAQGNPDDYLHVTLTDEEEVLDAIGRLRGAYPNVMSLSFENRRSKAEFDRQEDIDLGRIDAFALFAELYEAQNGAGMTKEQRALVKALLSEIGGQV